MDVYLRRRRAGGGIPGVLGQGRIHAGPGDRDRLDLRGLGSRSPAGPFGVDLPRQLTDCPSPSDLAGLSGPCDRRDGADRLETSPHGGIAPEEAEQGGPSPYLRPVEALARNGRYTKSSSTVLSRLTTPTERK